MKKKILVITRNVEFTFNNLRYEWPLEEQKACCQVYISKNVPEADVAHFSEEVLSLKKLVAYHKSETILIPSRLIFSGMIDVADKVVAVLEQIGFNVIEAIPHAKLAGIPEYNSHLVIAGDSKITSFCQLCLSANSYIPPKIFVDRMTEYVVFDDTILTDLQLLPTGLRYRPTFTGLIERYFPLSNLSSLRRLSKVSSNQNFDEDFLNRDEDPNVDED